MSIFQLTCTKKVCCKILAGKERDNSLENCSLIKKRRSNCALTHTSFKVLLMLRLWSKWAATQLQGENSTIITEITGGQPTILTMLDSISEIINHKWTNIKGQMQ